MTEGPLRAGGADRKGGHLVLEMVGLLLKLLTERPAIICHGVLDKAVDLERRRRRGGAGGVVDAYF